MMGEDGGTTAVRVPRQVMHVRCPILRAACPAVKPSKAILRLDCLPRKDLIAEDAVALPMPSPASRRAMLEARTPLGLRYRYDSICRPVTDMRLALLRHWTLYEALLYANYVAVRMHTYNDAGRNKMEDLLVNMGVPLAQSKHSYSALPAFAALSTSCTHSVPARLCLYGLPDRSPLHVEARRFGNIGMQ